MSGNWKQIAGWAGTSQGASRGSWPGTTAIVLPGGCVWSPARLTWEDLGTQQYGVLFCLVCFYVWMLLFIAEAALWGRGKQPPVGLDWNRRSVDNEPGAVSLASDPRCDHGLVALLRRDSGPCW